MAYDGKVLRLCARAACLLVAFCVFAQNQPTQQNQEPPAEGQATDQYFSGTVVSYSEEKVTVERTVLGKNSSQRSFSLTAQTQIDGKLKVKARVTVQFVTKDDVDQAIHIVVRSPGPKR